MRAEFEEIGQIAAAHGLAVVGITSAEPLEADAVRLADWQKRGFAAEMNYMLREPRRLASPRELLPDCRTVITFTVPYASDPHPPRPAGYGRVARYAWGRDYHEVLPHAMEGFCAAIISRYSSECRMRHFTDAVPLLERALAARSKIGFVGRNTLIIRPGMGSFMFLAEVLTNIEIDGLPEIRKSAGCGSCVRCQKSCPTGALDEQYLLDSRRCISYLSIEKRGALQLPERRMLGEWVFGCDICQEVCPFNHRALRGKTAKAREEFGRGAGAGPLLDLSEILSLRTNREFEKRFIGSAILRARRSGLLRNAAIVAANTSSTGTVPALITAAESDSSAAVRQHCAWALRVLHPELTGAERVRTETALEKITRDPDPVVAAEGRGC